MDKKIPASIILGVLMISIFGLYYSQTSVLRINSRNSINYSGKLMPDFRNSDVSSIFISSAKSKINEIEIYSEYFESKNSWFEWLVFF